MDTYIKNLREKKHISQAELARQVDVSRSYINRIEKGTRTASLELARDIADALGVTIDYLVYKEKFKELDDNAKT